jgi:hypothetical protein
MPAIVEVTENVRLADLLVREDKFMNLDLVSSLPSVQDFSEDEN